MAGADKRPAAEGEASRRRTGGVRAHHGPLREGGVLPKSDDRGRRGSSDRRGRRVLHLYGRRVSELKRDPLL